MGKTIQFNTFLAEQRFQLRLRELKSQGRNVSSSRSDTYSTSQTCQQGGVNLFAAFLPELVSRFLPQTGFIVTPPAPKWDEVIRQNKVKGKKVLTGEKPRSKGLCLMLPG